MGLDDKWRGGGGKGGKRGAGTGGEEQFSIFQLYSTEAFSEKL